ncbi:hypothetical protein [Aquabacter spiritensis]|uniref:hypothetical protein n=1 Tax=Aquabacter spiritensis TaxID=933073 RepID=UPI001042E6E4|nr:hypothetical protein [Aquabacter spiritensis]
MCRTDGTIGPFINTSRIGPAFKGHVTLFNNSDFIRASNFFDMNEDSGVVAFPPNWEYTAGTENEQGYFIAISDLSAEAAQSVVARHRNLVSQIQIVLLQVATSKFVGAEISGSKYVVEIDAASLTPAIWQACLEHAGYRAAVDRLRTLLDAPVSPREAQGLCVELFKYSDALARATASFGEPERIAFGSEIRYPTGERADCFTPHKRSKLDLAKASLEAAEATATFDYAAFIAAAGRIALDEDVYRRLRSEWQVADLPSLAHAEREAALARQIALLRKLYFQYSRILACNEAFRDSLLTPISPGKMTAVKVGLAEIERQLSSQTDIEPIWEAATQSYHGSVASIRATAAWSTNTALDACANQLARLESSMNRTLIGMAPLKKDFGADWVLPKDAMPAARQGPAGSPLAFDDHHTTRR